VKVSREEALRVILDSVSVNAIKEYVVLEEALGRVLAEDLFSPVDVPDVNKSAVDGFAFRSDSIKKLPFSLKIVGEVKAGDIPEFSLKNGETAFVMTGGAVPKGADAVVRVEDVSVENGWIRGEIPVSKGSLVNFVGSEFKKGEAVLSRGEKLDYKKVSLLAYLGIYKVKVYGILSVGIATTGDEVLEPYEAYRIGSVRNTNYYLLKGLLKKEGISPVNLGNLVDDLDETVRLLGEAFEKVDVVVTTGGVSKGKYDFVKKAIKSLGFDIKFTSTNIKPGRPLVFAVKGKKVFFGLPGYPSATFVNALEFLIPALRKMAGFKEFRNRYLKLPAGETLKGKEGRVDFVRVILKENGGITRVYSSGSQMTSNFKTIALSEGLAIIDESRGRVEEGEIIDVYLL